MARLRQAENRRRSELVLQYRQVVRPSHCHIRLTLHDQRAARAAQSTFDTRDPAAQRTDPGSRQAARLQWVAVLQEVDEIGVVGILAEAPRNLLDEVAQHAITELRPGPGSRAHQRSQQNSLAHLGAGLAAQQVIDEDRPASTLPAQVPGLGQLQGRRLGEHALQHVLVLGEVADAGTRAAGQTMPRQVDRQHRKAQAKRPLDHMAIQAAVVVVAMQQQQGRPRRLRPPGLGGDAVTGDLEVAQPAVRRQRLPEAIEGAIRLLLGRQHRRCG
ncbi:hypothetical protein FQZ97_796140 [compost metagenome]